MSIFADWCTHQHQMFRNYFFNTRLHTVRSVWQNKTMLTSKTTSVICLHCNVCVSLKTSTATHSRQTIQLMTTQLNTQPKNSCIAYQLVSWTSRAELDSTTQTLIESACTGEFLNRKSKHTNTYANVCTKASYDCDTCDTDAGCVRACDSTSSASETMLWLLLNGFSGVERCGSTSL